MQQKETKKKEKEMQHTPHVYTPIGKEEEVTKWDEKNMFPHGSVECIDVVYTWVQLTEELHKVKNQWLRQLKKPTKNRLDANRWQQSNELMYSIRSIYTFAPWVRRIYIVTNGQRPKWLAENSEDLSIPIHIVTHAEIFPDPIRDLPTFNSHAIELHLHRIHDLSEHYLYFNDDMFLGAAVHPNDFFSTGGLPRYRFTGVCPRPPRKQEMSQHAHAWITNGHILDQLFPNKAKNQVRPYPAHQCVPMVKSFVTNIANDDRLKAVLDQTSHSRFRKSSNVYFIGFMIFCAVYMNKATKGHASNFYIDIRENTQVSYIGQRLNHLKPQLFCINDTVTDTKLRQAKSVALQKMLRDYFPIPTIAEMQ